MTAYRAATIELDGQPTTGTITPATDPTAQAGMRSLAFEDWIGNRTVRTFGTNDGAAPLAYQSWHHFKEAFPPEFIHYAITQSELPVKVCLDPFGGSGTTALTCRMLGIDSTTVEVNPFLADAIKARVATYDTDSLINSLMHVRRKARRISLEASKYFASVPQHSYLRPGLRGRWIFEPGVADRLACLLASIDSLSDEHHARLLRVIIGGLLVSVSNVTVSGKGRRYRRNWQDQSQTAHDVDSIFARRAEQAIMDITRFSRRFGGDSRVIEGDAREVHPDKAHQMANLFAALPQILSIILTCITSSCGWLGYLRNSQEFGDCEPLP